jgi:hypothetical protein
LRKQKAEIERREKAYTQELQKLLRVQQERLTKLGVGASLTLPTLQAVEPPAGPSAPGIPVPSSPVGALPKEDVPQNLVPALPPGPASN